MPELSGKPPNAVWRLCALAFLAVVERIGASLETWGRTGQRLQAWALERKAKL